MKIKNHCKVDIKGLEMEKALLEEHVRYGEARFRDKELVRHFVNRIYQDLAELESVMKPKMCDTCTYFDNELLGGDCLNFGFRCTSAGAEANRPDDGFCCNRYEAKEQL